MSNIRINQSVSFTIVALMSLLAAPVVSAQGSSTLEEIVVTANKRGAVSLQDTPGSIQAIGAETLERTLVEGFEDYIKMVPGLTSVSSGTGQSQIVIRGINSNRVTHTQAQTRSLAGLYIDEMPISLAGLNPDLGVIDVERIEVLKGPQGTLYGASSMSGTIRIITKKPDTEKLSGKVSADVSDTKDGDINYGYKGSVNVPLSDNIALRASAYSSQKGGYIDNAEPTNLREDYNKEDTIGTKLQLAFYGDKLDATATFMYNRLNAEGRPDQFIPDATDARLVAVTDDLETSKFIDDSFENEFLGLNFTLDYDLEGINIFSSTSFFDTTIFNRLDDTFRVRAVTPIRPPLSPFSDFRNNTRYRTKIEEFRLSSTYDSPLQWIIGGYYEANRKKFRQTQPTPGTNAFFVSIGGPPPCPTLTSTCFGAVTDSVFDGTESVKTDQVAIFGEATYNITDALRLKLGFRWFDYESDVQIFAAGPANGGATFVDDTIKEDDWVPKVELSYDISDDHMVYATYSEGYRLGGVNGFIPAATLVPCAPQLAALGTTVGAPFSSDSITNYELGAKTAWLDNRLTANVSVYRNEFKDIQSQIVLNCGFLQTLNAGELENTGIDAEFAYQASEALALRFGFAYIDSEVSSAIAGLNSDGDEAPYVPEFSASGSAEYGIPIWNGFGFIRADIRHVSSSSNEFTSVATAVTLDSYTIADLTLGYEQDGWGLNVFARNLFDEEIVTNIDPDRIQPSQLTRGRPRQVGVSVSKSF